MIISACLMKVIYCLLMEIPKKKKNSEALDYFPHAFLFELPSRPCLICTIERTQGFMKSTSVSACVKVQREHNDPFVKFAT